MTDIYRNSIKEVHLDIQGANADATPTATANGNALVVTAGTSPATGVERWVATIGIDKTQNVGELPVVWSFTINGGTAVTQTDYYDVVVPLVSVSDLLVEFEDCGETEEELIKAEHKVRTFIESYTGQVFAPYDATVILKVSGTTFFLPKKLISFTESDPVFLSAPVIEGDGWKLRVTAPLDYDYPGVIQAPYSSLDTYYRYSRQVSITGRWGYERVPNQVREAAIILIGDLLSPDSVYRDKGLISLTSPDWRIQYHASALKGTGSIRVDQLLEDYVVKSVGAVI